MRSQETEFRTADGLKLFERSWLPDGKRRAVVVIVHGLAEHSGRYEHVGDRLAGAGYATYAYDLRGHGRSEGERSYFRSFDGHLADLEAYLALVRSREGDAPLLLLGHSMGGTIVALFLAGGDRGVSGAVLSGAALNMGGGLARIGQGLILLLGRLTPRLPLGKMKSSDVCRDPAVSARYDEDPLVYRGRIRAGSAAAFVRALRDFGPTMGRITTPLALLHGTADKLTDPEGSRLLYQRAGTNDKTLKLYEGLYHEILNEPEKEQVLSDVVEWFDARTEGR